MWFCFNAFLNQGGAIKKLIEGKRLKLTVKLFKYSSNFRKVGEFELKIGKKISLN